MILNSSYREIYGYKLLNRKYIKLGKRGEFLYSDGVVRGLNARLVVM